MYVCIYYVYTYLYICICYAYIHIYKCVYIYICIYMFIYMHFCNCYIFALSTFAVCVSVPKSSPVNCPHLSLSHPSCILLFIILLNIYHSCGSCCIYMCVFSVTKVAFWSPSPLGRVWICVCPL